MLLINVILLSVLINNANLKPLVSLISSAKKLIMKLLKVLRDISLRIYLELFIVIITARRTSFYKGDLRSVFETLASKSSINYLKLSHAHYLKRLDTYIIRIIQ